MTAHRCAGGLKKKLDLRSGSQRHRHFVGFFNVPVLAPTRDQPFYTGDSDTPPHLVAFYDHAGDTEVHILDLTPPPPGPHGGMMIAIICKEKKEEIWLSPMTKAHTPTEMSKGQSDNIKNATKKFDYTAVADRLRTVSWSNYSHPTGVVNRFTGPPSH